MGGGCFIIGCSRAMAIAVIACCFFKNAFAPWAGFILVLGNSFPSFHGFRDGRGVVKSLGFTALIAPWALIAAAVWLASYGIRRGFFLGLDLGLWALLPVLYRIFLQDDVLGLGTIIYYSWTRPAITGAG